jgi:signal transduction histidine kinase
VVISQEASTPPLLTTAESRSRDRARTATPPAALRVEAQAFITGVVVVAAGLSALSLRGQAVGMVGPIALWAIAAGFGQVLTFPSLTGRGHVSLSTAAHLCMVLALSPAEFLPALGLSRLAVALIERKPWYRSLFNAAQVSVAMVLAWFAYGAVAGTHVFAPVPGRLAGPIAGFMAAAVVYYVCNVGAVSTVIALTSRTSPWQAWRTNYGHRQEVAGTLALVLLSPLIALAYSSFGGFGLLAFLLPIVFLYDASLRYVVIRRTQESLIDSQRQAAKAELAAEIGRDINTYLCVVQAQVQMLAIRKDRLEPGEYEKRLGVAQEHLRHIDLLSRGLLDMARKESVAERVELSEMITSTVDFLQPQRRFNDVKVRLMLDARAGVVSADPQQLQQVLISLLMEAAERTALSGPDDRTITVRLRAIRPNALVELSVSDSGPPVAEALRSRMFDVGSEGPTGKVGRFIVYSIVRNHRGSIAVDAAPEGGITVRVMLPRLQEPAVLRRRVRPDDPLRAEARAA